MSRQNLLWTLGILLPALTCSSTAFAWGPSTHENLAYRAMVDTENNVVTAGGAALLTLHPEWDIYDLRDIALMSDSLDLQPYKDQYHSGAWPTIRDRGYWTQIRWANLDEKTRLAFLLHLAYDSGVPSHHDPAGDIMNDYEPAFEARVESAMLSNPFSGGSIPAPYYATGKQDEIMGSGGIFETRMHAVAQFAHDNVTSSWEAMYGFDGAVAVTAGISFSRANAITMLCDYYLLQKDVEAHIQDPQTLSPGQSLTITAADSIDPDSCTYVFDGNQIYQNDPGAGIACAMFDFGEDGDYEYLVTQADGLTKTLTYQQVLSACGLNSAPLYSPVNVSIRARVYDDDGPCGWKSYDLDYSYAYSYITLLPTNVVPEPMTMSLLAIGGLALLKRKR